MVEAEFKSNSRVLKWAAQVEYKQCVTAFLLFKSIKVVSSAKLFWKHPKNEI